MNKLYVCMYIYIYTICIIYIYMHVTSFSFLGAHLVNPRGSQRPPRSRCTQRGRFDPQVAGTRDPVHPVCWDSMLIAKHIIAKQLLLTCFVIGKDMKRPYFGCLVVQNRGQSGSRQLYLNPNHPTGQ